MNEARRIVQQLREQAVSRGPDARLEINVSHKILKLYRPRRQAEEGLSFADIRREVPEFPYLLRASAPSPPLEKRHDSVFPLWFGPKIANVPPVADLLEFMKSFDASTPCAVVFLRHGFSAMVAYTGGVLLPEKGCVLKARFPSYAISVRSFPEWLREVRTVCPPGSPPRNH